MSTSHSPARKPSGKSEPESPQPPDASPTIESERVRLEKEDEERQKKRRAKSNMGVSEAIALVVYHRLIGAATPPTDEQNEELQEAVDSLHAKFTPKKKDDNK